VRSLLEGFPDIELTQGMVTRLLTDGARVSGVVTADGRSLHARAVVLTRRHFSAAASTSGTDTQIPAGRAGESAGRRYPRTHTLNTLWTYSVAFQEPARRREWTAVPSTGPGVERQDGDGNRLPLLLL